MKDFKPLVYLNQHRREATGVLLLAAAGLSAYSLYFSAQGWLVENWSFFLGYIFGWIKVLIPFLLLLAAVLVLVPGTRQHIPKPPLDQAFGIVLFVFLVFILADLMAGPIELESGLERARQGTGGGVIGTYLLVGMILLLGTAGATVTLIGWALAAGLLTFRISLAELAGWAAAGIRWAWQQIPRPRNKITPVESSTPSYPQTMQASPMPLQQDSEPLAGTDEPDQEAPGNSLWLRTSWNRGRKAVLMRITVTHGRG